MSAAAVDLSRLSLDEQLDLLDELWTSVGRNPDSFPLSEEQRADLDQRLDELERDGPVGLTWDEVVSGIRAGDR